MRNYQTPTVDLVGAASNLIQAGGGPVPDGQPEEQTILLQSKLEEE